MQLAFWLNYFYSGVGGDAVERLQKVLARAGIASRRKSEEIILQGRVKVNGKVVRKLGTKVDPDNDKIELDDRPIKGKEKKVYILLYKPSGYVTTMKDPQGRKTVADLVSPIPQRIYPVGRLDYDTEGLLLMTNDGKLVYRLTHPSHEVKKTYLATVKGHPSERALRRLRHGIKLEDGMTAPARVKLLKAYNNSSLLELIIHEGKNRQVRRMCEAVGHPVLKLKRTKVGFLTLDNLSKGEFRYLTNSEIKRLKEMY
ncbi:MAG: rRNA synthase [Clostridia bacterium]|nr:rRNA synthase [Clostridia bacterium]